MVLKKIMPTACNYLRSYTKLASYADFLWARHAIFRGGRKSAQEANDEMRLEHQEEDIK